MEEPSINKLHEQSISTQRQTRLRTISLFGNLKFPEGGERLADRVMTRNHGFLQRRRKGLQAYREYSFREGEEIFSIVRKFY